MLLRVLRIALTATIVSAVLVVVHAGPVGANHARPVTVCAVSGAIDVDATGQLPPGGPTSGTYTFFDVAMVCAGGLTGVGGGDSSGFTGLGCGAPAFAVPGTLGQFCGGYSTNVGGGCQGWIGGPGMWLARGVIGPWSLTVGNLLTGWIDCNHGGSVKTAGAIALVAVPLAPNTQASPLNPDGGAFVEVDVDVVANNKDCPDSGPADWPNELPNQVEGELEGETGEPQVWFCRLLVSGVAVIAD